MSGTIYRKFTLPDVITALKLRFPGDAALQAVNEHNGESYVFATPLGRSVIGLAIAPTVVEGQGELNLIGGEYA